MENPGSSFTGIKENQQKQEDGRFFHSWKSPLFKSGAGNGERNIN
jgi:hypothetical protein